MNTEYTNNSVAGTGAAINVNLGFTPSRVRVWNPAGGTELVWFSALADGGGQKDVAAGTYLLTETTAAIGSTPANVATNAFKFQVAGTTYSKAAVAAGTAPAATTIPTGKYGLFSWEIGADGTIDAGVDATGNATGYSTAAAAIAAMPAPSASHIRIAYITVTSSATAGFVGATTSLAATTASVVYYGVDPVNNVTAGITPIEPGDSTSIPGGFTIGADADLNVSGDTLYYEAWR